MPWAEQRLAEKAAENRAHGLPKAYAGGEDFPYRGGSFKLTVVVTDKNRRPACDFDGARFMVTISGASGDEPAAVRKALVKWYRRTAEAEVADRIAYWGPIVGRMPSSITIRNQKTRWGSCSTKGAVNFNWRLIMVRPEIMDYVIVHELCHLLQHNHSAAYWALVAKVLPDYKQQRSELRGAAHCLEIG